MKKSISIWQFAGFAATSLLGTLLHFLYDFTGENFFAALFSGVNESTWEHMKLLFFPMFLFAIVQSFFFRERADFWCIKLRGTLLGLALIPVIFYTYNGVIGPSPDFVNIAIFFVAAAAAYIYETRLFYADKKPCTKPYLPLAALVLLAVLFMVFTFRTPTLAIFKDPISGVYGVAHLIPYFSMI